MPVSWLGHARTPKRFKLAARLVDAMSQTPAQSLQSLVDAAHYPAC